MIASNAIRGLYTLVLALVQPLLAVYLLKRAARQPEYRAAWSQRFLAAVPKCDMLTNGQRRQWVHAVSVGEAHAISPLVKHWAKVYPTDVWVISCTTPTGLATCKSLYSHLNGVVFCYLPYDLPWLMSRCMARLKATSLWLVETELWPNLLAVARRRGLPVALLNARISPTTGKRLRQLSLLSKPAIQGLHTVVCQTAADAAVFESLGRPVDAICGNLKFDVDLRPELAAMGRQWRQLAQGNPVLLFASSREGEEPLLLEALLRTQFFKRLPQAAVWIVPRHPQRTDEVFDLMVQAATRLGVARPVRRSQWGTQADAALAPKGTEGRGQVRLVLGDSMGEMPAYYSLADMALLGGSWLELGGQNLIEACAYGCPVWMGPHTFNFKKAAEDALAAGAARRFESLQAACEAFMDKQFDLEAMKKSAFSYARSHRGATLTTFNALNIRVS